MSQYLQEHLGDTLYYVDISEDTDYANWLEENLTLLMPLYHKQLFIKMVKLNQVNQVHYHIIDYQSCLNKKVTMVLK
ncbi:hypothetical protein SD457_18230 [Coprobacillaceae bacterium CR2/5/TPMF4]|nr:hypothetical protein SD457_18230 [Coprobacillaceae bacterium CR2/5/TPMF4]